MIFQPELADLVLAGKKTQTRRRMSDNPNSPWWRERCRYKPGGDYAVNPGRGVLQVGRILVTEVYAEGLGTISEQSARAEGFANVADFFDGFEEINGEIDLDELVWVLHFQPLEVADGD